MKIKAVTEVEVSDEYLFDAIKAGVGLSDYAIIDGVLKCYDRVRMIMIGWLVNKNEFKIKRLEMISELKKR